MKIKSIQQKNKLIIAAVIALSVILLASILELTNVTHFFPTNKSPVLDVSSKTPTESSSSGNNQKGEPATSSNTSNTSGIDGTQPRDTKSNPGGGASTSLLAPSGDFVSNHHPNLSGSPAPNIISSVCTSTPGAECIIKFTKDGVTKSLESQTTDSNGSSYWSWKLQDLGLTAGQWQIQASASLNGSTKTSDDVLSLVVAP